MKDFILTSNRSVYNPLSRVNNKSLQMSSLEIKIVLLLHESSRACLFLCFCSCSPILCIFLMFLYSFYFILRLRLRVSYFPFNIGQTIRNSKSFFQFPGEGQSPSYKTELTRMKTTSELYCSSGAHNTGISHAVVS